MDGMDYAVLRNTMRTVFESDLAYDRPEVERLPDESDEDFEKRKKEKEEIKKIDALNKKEDRTLEKDEFTQLCRLMMFALDRDNLKKNRELMKEAKKKKVERLPG